MADSRHQDETSVFYWQNNAQFTQFRNTKLCFIASKCHSAHNPR